MELFDINNTSAPFKINTIYTGVANDIFGGLALNNGYIFAADYGVAGSYSNLYAFNR